MAWIIFTVLLAVVFWVAFGMWLYARKRHAEWEETVVPDSLGRRRGEPMLPILPLAAMVGTVAVWVLLTGFLMVNTVGERQVGIVYNFTGTIAGKRDKGWVVIAPWQSMQKENIAIQHEEFLFGKDNSAVSKDQQDIFANLAVNYSIDSENVLDLYRRVGPSWKATIIESRVPQVFKEVTSTFQTPDITERREDLRKQTRERLSDELSPYDIKVIDVFITNLGFSQQYSQAIEEKQQQVQDALRAQAKVKQIEAEARQKVAAAEGEAKSNVARARGEAKANRLRSRSITPSLIQWEAIQRLNPNTSLIICPPNSVCVPNAVVPKP